MKIRDYINKLKEQNIHLSLNGNEIEIDSSNKMIEDEVLQFISNNKDEVIQYLELLSSRKREFLNIEQVEYREDYPLSYGQKRLWTLGQLTEGNKAYNTQDDYELNGSVNVQIFKDSFRWLIERHEILRTAFKKNSKGEVRQYIYTKEDYIFDIALMDFTSSSNPELELQKFTEENYDTVFNLESGPLIKGTLIKLAPERYVCSLLMHHIICDGWSRKTIMRDIIYKYNSLTAGLQNNLSGLRIQYKDYSVWQENKFRNNQFEDHKNYWLKQLEGNLSTFTVEGDKLRPKIKTYNGGLIIRRIKKDHIQKLKEIINRQGATLYMGLLSIVKTLLYHYTGQTDIVIGCPVAGRDHVDLESQIGFYVNTLPIRTQLSGSDTFNQIVQKTLRTTTQAYDYQAYPFDKIVDDLKIPIDVGSHPLFNIMVALQNNELVSFNNEVELSDGLKVKLREGAKNFTSKFDLLFDFVEINGEIHSTLQYNSDIYYNSTVERMMDHLMQIAVSGIDNPDISIDLLDLVIGSEKEKLLHNFNNTSQEYPSNTSIISLFEKCSKENSNSIAIVFEDEQITYEELNSRANKLANLLLSKAKVRKGDKIGLLKSRSADYVVTVLGILKTGAVYVPLEGESPNERLKFIIESSKLKFLISEDIYKEKLNEFAKISGLQGVIIANNSKDKNKGLVSFLFNTTNGGDSQKSYNLSEQSSENLNIDIESDDLVYIIHTSGTTGNPKGVMVENKNVIRLVRESNYISITQTDSLLSFSNFSFDGSTFDIFGSLLNGAKLVIPKQEVLYNLIEVEEIIIKDKVTTFFITTALFNELVENNFPSIDKLKCILFGGEKVSVKHVRKFKELYPDVRLLHVYGPTENTTFSTFYEVDQVNNAQLTIPIGKGISNTRCYVFNKQGKLSPIGIQGELYLAGDGISRGYSNDTELTNKKFIINPFIPEERIYKTGDIVKWLPSGDIVFIGRNDAQVKIRGFRIELSEIEKTILNYTGISEVIVLAEPNPMLGDMELQAYIIGDKELDFSVLKDYLSSYIPDYMIPRHFVQIDKMPLNHSGKIDKKKLLNLRNEFDHVEKEEDKLSTENEFKVAKIWKEILGLEKVGLNDNFFENGGHSLKATKFVNHVFKEFGIKLDLRDLFTRTLLKEQVQLIEETIASNYVGIKPVQKAEYYNLSASQRRLWIISQLEGGNTAYNISGKYEFEGHLDVEALEKSYKSLIERHEVLRTVFKQNDLGEVKQWIHQAKKVKNSFSFLNLCDKPNAKEKIEHLVREECEREFDLEQGPLVNAVLIQYTPVNYVFVIVVHHIIADGWSVPLIIKELSFFYNSYRKNTNPTMKPLKIQYKDFVYWQIEQMQTENYVKAKNYWIQQFNEKIPLLEMPTDRERPTTKTFGGGSIDFKIQKEVADKFRTLLANEDCTLFMGLLGVVSVLLYRYTSNNDIVIGTPIAGREHIDLEDQVGFYVNTLPLRIKFGGDNTFHTLLNLIKKVTLDAYKNQLFPFDELLKNIDISRQNNRQPLFDIMVTLHNLDTDQENYWSESLTDIKVSHYNEIEHKTSKFDLNFDFRETSSDLICMFEYDSDLFNKNTMIRFVKHFEQIVNLVVEQSHTEIDSLDYLLPEEKDELFKGFNKTFCALDNKKTVVDLFEEKVTSMPNNIALVYKDTSFTYSDLNQKINQLARYLDTFSVNPNTPIFVCIDRSEWSTICMMSIFKIGAVYVPIDKQWPSSRIDDVLNRYETKLIITDDNELSNNSNNIIRLNQGLPLEDFDHNNLKRELIQASSSYIIHTSGSTGKPKGVEQTHLTLFNLIQWQIHGSGLLNGEKYMQYFSYAFDVSLTDVCFTLCTGGELHVLDKEVRANLILLQKYIVDNQIRVISLPYAVLNTLFNETYFEDHTLQNIISTGEQLYITGGLRKFLNENPEVEIFNLYGPSETHVVTGSSYKFTNQAIPIKPSLGKPIDNTKIFILDKNHLLVPVGVEGEIYISGSNLASGYSLEPNLTSEVFLDNPLEPGSIFYKSGDRAKWLENGEIEYLGRKDHQVKINGFRVELEEIDLALKAHPDIHEALVVNQADKNSEVLIAYIVSDKEHDIYDITKFLKLSLPDYMIPATFIILNEVPLTSNGKIDKKRLSANNGIKLENKVGYVEPRNDIEKKLVQIWCNVLEKNTIGVKDNFFSLGGHSLMVTIVLSRIYTFYGIKLSIEMFFQFPTIESLANEISNQIETNSLNSEGDENSDIESIVI